MEQDERLIKVILCVCVRKASVFVSNLWVFPFFVGTCKLWSQAIHVQVCAVSLPIFIQHSAAVHHEHLEKARLRHKHAMARVRMEKVLDISYCCNVVQTYARFCKWHGCCKSVQVFGSIYSPYNFLHVIKDKVEMLKQLKTLEREDRTHRQKMLGAMPVSAYALCILGISVNHETVVQKVVVAIMLTF